MKISKDNINMRRKRILEVLLLTHIERKGITLDKIAESSGISKKSVWTHLRYFKEKNIVSKESRRKGHYYISNFENAISWLKSNRNIMDSVEKSYFYLSPLSDILEKFSEHEDIELVVSGSFGLGFLFPEFVGTRLIGYTNDIEKTDEVLKSMGAKEVFDKRRGSIHLVEEYPLIHESAQNFANSTIASNLHIYLDNYSLGGREREVAERNVFGILQQ